MKPDRHSGSTSTTCTAPNARAPHLSVATHHIARTSTAHAARQPRIATAISTAGVNFSASLGPVGGQGLPDSADQPAVGAYQQSGALRGSCGEHHDKPSAAIAAGCNALHFIAIGCAVHAEVPAHGSKAWVASTRACGKRWADSWC